MLDMDDKQLIAELERSFLLSDERHQKICDTIEEMIQEVDRLLLKVDEMEDEALDESDRESMHG